MKNLAIFLKFTRKFRDFFKIFWNFIEFYFWRKFGQQFWYLRNMHSYGVRGAETPDASEFLEIWVEKSMETCDFLIIRIEF